MLLLVAHILNNKKLFKALSNFFQGKKYLSDDLVKWFLKTIKHKFRSV